MMLVPKKSLHLNQISQNPLIRFYNSHASRRSIPMVLTARVLKLEQIQLQVEKLCLKQDVKC